MGGTDTLNAWLAFNGYRWLEGEERMYKSQMTWVEARAIIEQLLEEGVLVKA